MAREKNLSTIVRDERKRIHMVPGRLVLRPRGEAVVELKSGGFDKIMQDTIAIETEGEFRMGMYSRLLDPADEKDSEILQLTQEWMDANPMLANSVDVQMKIVGEFDALEPWAGYADQSAEQVETLYRAMPDAARPNLEMAMKYELSLDEPSDEKIKVLNKLHREAEARMKDAAEETVSL